MPFVPLTPEEERLAPPCNDPEHNPPTHMVVTETMKWRCPGCGREVLIRPPSISWGLDRGVAAF